MTVAITILGSHILALLQFTNAKSERVGANTLYFDIRQKFVRVVATCGAMLGASRETNITGAENLPSFPARIHVSDFKNLKANDIVKIVFEPAPEYQFATDDHEGINYTVSYGIVSITAKSAPCRWYNYGINFPITASGESAHFSVIHMATLNKVSSILIGAKTKSHAFITIMPNGPKPALINFGVDFFTGILAPLKLNVAESSLTAPPGWIFAD